MGLFNALKRIGSFFPKKDKNITQSPSSETKIITLTKDPNKDHRPKNFKEIIRHHLTNWKLYVGTTSTLQLVTGVFAVFFTICIVLIYKAEIIQGIHEVGVILNGMSSKKTRRELLLLNGYKQDMLNSKKQLLACEKSGNKSIENMLRNENIGLRKRYLDEADRSLKLGNELKLMLKNK